MFGVKGAQHAKFVCRKGRTRQDYFCGRVLAGVPVDCSPPKRGGADESSVLSFSIILMEKSTGCFSRLSAPWLAKPCVAPCRHYPLSPIALMQLPLDTGCLSDPMTDSQPMRTGLVQLTTQPFLPRFSKCKLHSTPLRMLKFMIIKQIFIYISLPQRALRY